jgi:hypothetical protein
MDVRRIDEAIALQSQDIQAGGELPGSVIPVQQGRLSLEAATLQIRRCSRSQGLEKLAILA